MPNRTASLLVLYNKHGDILLQHRDKHATYYPEHWGFFGGGVEDSESPSDALKREIREELKIEIQEIPLFRTYTTQEDTGIKIRHVFLAPTNTTIEQIKQHQHEGDDAGFFSQDEVQNLKINPYLKCVLDDIFLKLNNKSETLSAEHSSNSSNMMW